MQDPWWKDPNSLSYIYVMNQTRYLICLFDYWLMNRIVFSINLLQYFDNLKQCNLWIVLNRSNKHENYINKRHLTRALRIFPIVVVTINENMNKTESRVFNRDFPCGGRRYELNNNATSAHNDTFIWLNNPPRGWRSTYVVVLYQFHCIAHRFFY